MVNILWSSTFTRRNDVEFNATYTSSFFLSTIKELENLIKEALNYDSTVYKQALGSDYADQNTPNGVLKSQELH